MALDACDLELVTFLLSKADPTALFARKPLPLSQPVLLALLHQLSAAELRGEVGRLMELKRWDWSSPIGTLRSDRSIEKQWTDFINV